MLTADDATAARQLTAELRADTRKGLTATPKQLSPKWLYDARGSALFQAITQQPAHHLTRLETRCLAESAAGIASATTARTLIELGSGYASNTSLLIDAMSRQGTLSLYMPVDISWDALSWAHAALACAHPMLLVHPVLGDFTMALGLPQSEGPRLVICLGGTLGNLLPEERATLLGALRARLAPEDALLLGVDLVKNPATMLTEHNDVAGRSAAFSKNLLTRLNRELGANFDLDLFEHVTVWNAETEWIEMRLRSLKEHNVTLRGLDGLTVHFDEGEELRTEVSAKFRPTGLASELAAADFEMTRWYTDPDLYYGLALATPRQSAPSPTY